MACGCAHNPNGTCVCSETCSQPCGGRVAADAAARYRLEYARLRMVVRRAIVRLEALRALAEASGLRYDVQLLGRTIALLRAGLEETSGDDS